MWYFMASFAWYFQNTCWFEYRGVSERPEEVACHLKEHTALMSLRLSLQVGSCIHNVGSTCLHNARKPFFLIF